MESVAQYPPTSPASRAAAAAGALAVMGAASAVSYFDPARESFFPVCPMLKLTGFACPGCGLTRGMHALFHGDLATALDYNALTPIFALAGAYVLISLVMLAVRGRGFKLEFSKPWMLWSFLAVMLIFGVMRNLPFYPFTILYP